MYTLTIVVDLETDQNIGLLRLSINKLHNIFIRCSSHHTRYLWRYPRQL